MNIVSLFAALNQTQIIDPTATLYNVHTNRAFQRCALKCQSENSKGESPEMIDWGLCNSYLISKTKGVIFSEESSAAHLATV